MIIDDFSFNLVTTSDLCVAEQVRCDAGGGVVFFSVLGCRASRTGTCSRPCYGGADSLTMVFNILGKNDET